MALFYHTLWALFYHTLHYDDIYRGLKSNFQKALEKNHWSERLEI